MNILLQYLERQSILNILSILREDNANCCRRLIRSIVNAYLKYRRLIRSTVNIESTIALIVINTVDLHKKWDIMHFRVARRYLPRPYNIVVCKSSRRHVKALIPK